MASLHFRHLACARRKVSLLCDAFRCLLQPPQKPLPRHGGGSSGRCSRCDFDAAVGRRLTALFIEFASVMQPFTNTSLEGVSLRPCAVQQARFGEARDELAAAVASVGAACAACDARRELDLCLMQLDFVHDSADDLLARVDAVVWAGSATAIS